MTIEDSTDTDVFLTFLEQVLCPKLQPGHIVVMDNLSAHKAPAVREKIEATGASLLYCRLIRPTSTPLKNAGPRSN
jgi:transposase